MSAAVGVYKSAIRDGSLQVTRVMLEEQRARIDRIYKEQELARYKVLAGELENEQRDRIDLLSKILNVENVYLRMMQNRAPLERM